jgi:hypothetical protein
MKKSLLVTLTLAAGLLSVFANPQGVWAIADEELNEACQADYDDCVSDGEAKCKNGQIPREVSRWCEIYAHDIAGSRNKKLRDRLYAECVAQRCMPHFEQMCQSEYYLCVGVCGGTPCPSM